MVESPNMAQIVQIISDPEVVVVPNQSLTNKQQNAHHKEQFLIWLNAKYFNPLGALNRSSAISRVIGEKMLRIIQKEEDGDVRARERIKTRHLTRHTNEKNEIVLGIEVTEVQTKKKSIKEVAYIKDFYNILFYIHNTLVMHSGLQFFLNLSNYLIKSNIY